MENGFFKNMMIETIKNIFIMITTNNLFIYLMYT